MTDAPIAAPRRGTALGFWSFIALMVLLMALFVGLGTWQVERLGEKERLIASVAARASLPPIPLPPVAEWGAFDAHSFDFRQVVVTGHYQPKGTVLVFTSLSEPKGVRDGPGYWVMTPFAVSGGGTLFVNRGFIPQESASAFRSGADLPMGEIPLSGVVRVSEAIGAFTPEPDRSGHIEFVRDTTRLGQMAKLIAVIADPVAPLYLDLPAGPKGALPQGGETVMEFPNNHLGYALTWYGFAILVPFLLFFWIRRNRRPRAPDQP